MNAIDIGGLAGGGGATGPTATTATLERRVSGVRWADNAIFVGYHLATAIMVYLAGPPTWSAVGLCAAVYVACMFGITAGYHRYFSHRSFRTSRAFQFVLAVLGTIPIQKGVLWWSAHHRKHHRASDTEQDIHSPTRHGLWWAHVGWIMSPAYMATDFEQVKDLARFPELRWLNTYFVVPYVLLCIAVHFGLGFQHLVWGCFVSVVLLWHCTFTINSLSHVWGSRTYATTDTSRNNLLLALLTHGEGWHNNHHFYAASVRQGFRWWQVDLSYYVLCVLEKLGVVWGMKRPTPEVVDGWLGGACHRIGAPGATPAEPTQIVADVTDPAPASAAAP